MMKETEAIIVQHLDFLPLTTNANIIEGNALRIDWNEVVDKSKLNYIMGNPPFVGSSYCSAHQKQEVVDLFGKIKLSNSIDYVGGWYFKACELIQGTDIHCAFVSTNSITQGEQVEPLWGTLYKRFDVDINFGWRTFVWDSEAKEKAHVHVVIIGFSEKADRNKIIFDGENKISCENINPYLLDAPNIIIKSRSNPICDVPKILHGSKPSDGGNLILSPEEKEELIEKEPLSEQFIRPFASGGDYLNGKKRYCIWLVGANPTVLKKCPQILARVDRVRKMRLQSSAAATRKKAETPTLFFTITQPSSDMMLVGPQVSSGRRRYIPFGFTSTNLIANDMLLIMPNAHLYEFGIMMSNVHNSWTRAFAGRLKSDYRYSVNVVYNNFPWPTPTEEQKSKIEQTAQGILDARALYPDSSLADLYDPLTMPPELRKAHTANDIAVMRAYGFSTKMSEADCIRYLLRNNEVFRIALRNEDHNKGGLIDKMNDYKNITDTLNNAYKNIMISNHNPRFKRGFACAL